MWKGNPAARLALALTLTSVTFGCGDDDAMTTFDAGTDAGGSDDAGRMDDAGGGEDALVAHVAPGGACSCDAECEGTDAHRGLCVFGVCMNEASAECSAAGSSAECPAGSRCWGLGGSERSICWPDCDAHECVGTCDGDGSCVATDETSCDPTCGSLCGPGACSPEEPEGTCESESETCVGGVCTAVCSEANPDGACPEGSECDGGVCRLPGGCPTWRCDAGCTDLIRMPGSFDPNSAEAREAGYYLASRPEYSYLRRDLTYLVQHAACEVLRRYPGTAPIGLADLSQADGMVPGADRGSPRHPESTHRGDDLDIAYYQTDGTNDPQIICGDGSDTNANGRPGTHNDGYFCTTEENIVDWPRQAYWFAKLAATPLVRVFGIDETLADDFERELGALRDAGAISATEFSRASRLGYGADGGWPFHHHHTHNSYSRP